MIKKLLLGAPLLITPLLAMSCQVNNEPMVEEQETPKPPIVDPKPPVIGSEYDMSNTIGTEKDIIEKIVVDIINPVLTKENVQKWYDEQIASFETFHEQDKEFVIASMKNSLKSDVETLLLTETILSSIKATPEPSGWFYFGSKQYNVYECEYINNIKDITYESNPINGRTYKWKNFNPKLSQKYFFRLKV